eukprot:SAG11_NODE_16212_length_554_cov_1.232967_2_plen_68_part_01
MKKKWVKIYASLKDGALTLATDTPEQNGKAKGVVALELLTAIAIGKGEKGEDDGLAFTLLGAGGAVVA